MLWEKLRRPPHVGSTIVAAFRSVGASIILMRPWGICYTTHTCGFTGLVFVNIKASTSQRVPCLCRLDGIPLVVHRGSRARHVVDHILGAPQTQSKPRPSQRQALVFSKEHSPTEIPNKCPGCQTSQVFIRLADSTWLGVKTQERAAWATLR